MTLAAASGAGGAEHPKVIVLGFDGADGTLAETFMNDGSLPNLKRLRDQGTFHKLLSSNPAESPVAWACINTGCNPGKTNVFGFMRRFLHDASFEPKFDANGQLTNKAEYEKALGVRPGLGHMEDVQAPASVLLPFDPSKRQLYIGGAAVLCFLVIVLIMALVLHANIAVSALVALALAGGIGYGLHRWTSGLPSTVPSVASPEKAHGFWDYLDAANLRTVALQAAVTAPAQAGPHTRLLTGLGNRDVALGAGTWYVYTSQDFEWSRPMDTGGYLFRIKMKSADPASSVATFEAAVRGPVNFVEQERRHKEIEQLDHAIAATPAGPELEKLKKELTAKKFDYKDWDEKRKWTTVPLSGTVDQQQKSLRLTIGGETQTIKEGGWSDFFHPDFVISPWIKARGATRVHLARCEPDEVRLYMTVISWDPADPWPQMGLSSPPDFIKDLAREIGTFDTIGWSCETHALKDDQINDQSFMDDIGFTVTWRRDLLSKVLAWQDWDCLFQVIGETDRVAHMMYRHFDDQHPLYNATEADKPIHMLGRTFKKRDAIREIYREMDATVGMVLQKIDGGELPKDTVLMLCSDHGFSSFREEVELNRFLKDKGFLDAPVSEYGVLQADWSKTRAYALGLGSIYINLKGRERHQGADGKILDGIVDPKDYDRVCDEIIKALLEFKNDRKESHNARNVVKSARKRADVYTGDWWREEIGADGYVRKHGAGDIVVGFEWGYRVAWGTALGGVSEETLSDNKLNWSGDHVSIEPELVRGIFFCNRKLSKPVADVALTDIAPTVLALLGVPVPPSMDGQSVSFE
ncbi:MAG: alkaline phosphatase family protein [Planctomycetota bacterium]